MKPDNIATIKAAASGRWPVLLEYVGGIPRELLDGRHHPCPRCGGTDRFRFFNDNEGGAICNQCFDKKNGDGLSVIQWARGWDFNTALKELANFLNIPLEVGGRGKKPTDPSEHLDFKPWNDFLVWLWCRHKPGITPEAVQANGGRLARYRDQFTVIALPIFGPTGPTSKPVGWVIWNTTGGELPVYKKGHKGPADWTKMKTTHGSEAGIIGLDGLRKIDQAATIWKTEGPGDLLALWSAIPATERSATAVITNANGSRETPPGWLISKLDGKKVFVVHDADKPGQAGAEKWANVVVRRAEECRNVKLPYPVEESHGKDIRDFFIEGHTWSELAALAADSSPVSPTSLAPSEADDDPHRLARLFADRFLHEDGLTLRYWRDGFWRWNGTHYRQLSNHQIRAEIVACVKEEFDRLNLEAIEDGRDEDRTARKVTKALVANVMQALAGISFLDDALEQPAWLDEREADPSEMVPVANGILNLSRLLGGHVDSAVYPHTPHWFSQVCLPYEFDLDAECPRWNKFLERNLEGDEDRKTLLQQWFGYCLTTDTSHQKFLLLEGEGKNGKSVICACLAAMLGEGNCSHVALELFSQRFALTQTVGKLANIFGDVGEIDNVAEGFLKAFTAGDRMTFDRKNRDPIDAIPTAKLVLSCNNRPRFKDRSTGLWRRMILMPLNVQIEDAERVHGMDKPWWWRQSGELPGILLWAITGLQILRAEGRFIEPMLCKLALEDYRGEANPARAFLSENYAADESCVVEAGLVYNTYRKWCEENGYRALGERMFGKEVKRVFFESDRKRIGGKSNRKYFYTGITKIFPFDEENEDEDFSQQKFF